MAIQEYLKILQQGVTIWNDWRKSQLTLSIDLSNADLHKVYFKDINFKDADLSGAYLVEADLSKANLSNALLVGSDLRGALLGNADLNNADLSGVHLRGATLRGANLRGADLSGAILIGADLRETNLRETNFSNVDLRGVNLKGVNLKGVNLSKANLSRADLRGATMIGTNLIGANLSDAIIGQTVFGRLDLRLVKGLEMIKHDGPSEISVSTIEKSSGEIPDLFLRGVGVGEPLIEYAHSLFRRPIEYYTCFISYSSKDELIAKRLHNDLQQEGVRCWFALEDMNIGDKIKHRIDESIRLYDKLLLILSEHSIASSWVAYEVERALNKEPLGVPNVLYPVRVDQAILTCTTDWAKDIKETRHIGDFEQWTDPEQYLISFQRLLHALRDKAE